MRLIRPLLYWLPTLAWMVVIFGFSSQHSLHASTIAWQDFTIKKSAHFSEYFVYAILLYFSLFHTTRFARHQLLIFTLSISLLYAISDEYHQSYIPGRSPMVRDVAIDTAGAALALALVSTTRYYRYSH
jgi:VanZ family protein